MTLGRIERIAGGVVVALVVLLGVIGAVNSFRAVAEAVEPRMIRVLARGNWMDETGEIVSAGTPSMMIVSAGPCDSPAVRKRSISRLILSKFLQRPLPRLLAIGVLRAGLLLALNIRA